MPAFEKTRLFELPPAMFEDIWHEPSSSATLCGTVSLFVQVMTSPTFAFTGCDQVLLATVADTVAVPVESVTSAVSDRMPPDGAKLFYDNVKVGTPADVGDY